MATRKLALTDAAAAELKIPLASAKQLAEFAETVLGLDGVDYRLGPDKLLAKMRVAAYDKDVIDVEVAEADIRRIEPPMPQHKRRMATILIQNQEKAGGTEPVPVAVEGRQMFIERNKEQTVPWKYKHALDNAKKLIYETDENGRLKENPSEAHEYPFTVIREDPPLPEEQKAA